MARKSTTQKETNNIEMIEGFSNPTGSRQVFPESTPSDKLQDDSPVINYGTCAQKSPQTLLFEVRQKSVICSI
jgi:hypothetical protein